jgi:protocatechuate 3,4-dioxygenase beta subunit
MNDTFKHKTGSVSARRRKLLLAGGAAFMVAHTAAAQQCRTTPRDQLGPFYSGGAPEQTDLCTSGSGGKARLQVSGRVLGAPDCKPLAGALVEVWHADANGNYSGFTRGRKDDAACLLRASIKTDAEGRYSFATIVPAEYPGRPQHIHYRVSHAAHATLITQLYFARERGVADELVVNVQRDAQGISRAAFDITLARAA